MDFDLSPSQSEQLKLIKDLLANLENWKEENIRDVFSSVDKKIFPLIRKKITGQKSGPELLKIIHLLGKEKVLERLNY